MSLTIPFFRYLTTTLYFIIVILFYIRSEKVKREGEKPTHDNKLIILNKSETG